MRRTPRSHIIQKLPPMAKVVVAAVVVPDLRPGLAVACEGLVADLLFVLQRLGGIAVESALFETTIGEGSGPGPLVTTEVPHPDELIAARQRFDCDHALLLRVDWPDDARGGTTHGPPAEVRVEAELFRGDDSIWRRALPLVDGSVWQSRLALASELVEVATETPIDVRPLLHQGPDGLGAFARVCEARSEHRPLPERLELTRQAVALEPDYDEAWLLLQDLLFATRELDEAERLTEELPQRFPRLARMVLRRAQLHQQRGRDKQARADYYRVAALDADGLALYEAGVYMRSIGDEDEGAETLQRAVDRRCADPFLYEQLGVYRANQGEEVAAVLLWERALYLNPALHGILANLALGHHRLGNEDRADELFAEAEERAPDHFATHYNLGLYYQDLRNWKLAVRHLDTAIEMRPQLPLLYLSRGSCLYKLGRVTEARDALEHAIRLDPSGPVGMQGRRELAEIREPADPEESAREFFQRGAERVRAQQPAVAVPFLERAVELAPEHWQAWFYLGTCRRLLEQWDEAVHAFRRVLSLRDDQADAYNELAIALGQLGERDEALKAASRAFELRPGDAGVICNLGLALMESGDLAGARAQLEHARQLAPDDPIVRRCLEELASREAQGPR